MNGEEKMGRNSGFVQCRKPNYPEVSAVAEGPDSRRKLRFGIMCTSTVFQRWQSECIAELLAVPGVSPALLIVDAERTPPKPRRSLFAILSNNQLLWNSYNRLFVRKQLRSMEHVDLGQLLNAVPRIECSIERRGKHSQYFSPEDVGRVLEQKLDFIIRFAFNIIRGDILEAARYGVWSYHHDDLDKYRGQPACFWEIFDGDPVTGVTLQRLTEGIDNGIVLQKGWFKTVLKSYVRSRDAAFSGSVGFAARVCRDLIAGEGAYVDAEPSKTIAPIVRAPGNAAMVKFGIRLLNNKFTDSTNWFFKHDQWGIGIVDAPISRFLDPDFVPAVRWLPAPPRGTIIADPFGIRRHGITTVVYEELDDRSRKGMIMAVEVADSKHSDLPRQVMNLAVHLSYPYLIEDGADIFCIPEMAQAGELGLFRAIEFPWRWERVGTLLKGVKILDASVFRHEGRWWMLGAIKGPRESIELHGWHAPELCGPWTPHSCNPLSVDVRGARPGGTPFVHEGALYRPAQDLSVTYGGRIVIHRIDALTPTRYSERPVVTVEPRPEWPFPAGMHTLSSAGDKTIIDAKRRFFSPRAFARELGKVTGLAGPRK